MGWLFDGALIYEAGVNAGKYKISLKKSKKRASKIKRGRKNETRASNGRK